MRVYVSGGCKNGKSFFAQRLARAMRKTGLYYIATMRPRDEEDLERIRRHRRERLGWGFETVEQPENISEILDKCDCGASFLIDSVTALLSNEMFPVGSVNLGAADKIAGEFSRVLNRVRDIVIVSDYIFSDGARYGALTEEYRRALARVDRAAADACDAVVEIVFSRAAVHKGGELLAGLI
jgi:adenosylcobinamide kinase/adenosylcobinamide-phosphate guanylyltransferase